MYRRRFGPLFSGLLALVGAALPAGAQEDEKPDARPPVTLEEVFAAADAAPDRTAAMVRQRARAADAFGAYSPFLPSFTYRMAADRRTDPILSQAYLRYPRPEIVTQNITGTLGIAGSTPVGTTYELSAGTLFTETDDFQASLYRQYSPTVNFNVTQPLFRGAWPSVNLSAADRLQYAEREALAVVRSIGRLNRLAAGEAYLGVARADAQVELAERSRSFAVDFEELTKKLIDGGKLSRLDLALAQQSVAARTADVSRAKQVRYRSLLALAGALRRPSAINDLESRFFPLNEVLNWTDPSDDFDALLTTATDRNPDLAVIAAQSEQLNADLNREADAFRPDVNLVLAAQLGGLAGITGCVQGFKPDGITPCGVPSIYEGTYVDAVTNGARRPLYTVSVALEGSIPVPFAVPSLNGRARALELDMQALEQDRQVVLRAQRIGLEQALRDVRIGRLLVEQATETTQRAETALTAEQTKLKAGRSTGFDVLRAQDLLLGSQTQLFDAQFDYGVAVIRLRALLGEVDPPDPGETASQPKEAAHGPDQKSVP